MNKSGCENQIVLLWKSRKQEVKRLNKHFQYKSTVGFRVSTVDQQNLQHVLVSDQTSYETTEKSWVCIFSPADLLLSSALCFLIKLLFYLFCESSNNTGLGLGPPTQEQNSENCNHGRHQACACFWSSPGILSFWLLVRLDWGCWGCGWRGNNQTALWKWNSPRWLRAETAELNQWNSEWHLPFLPSAVPRHKLQPRASSFNSFSVSLIRQQETFRLDSPCLHSPDETGTTAILGHKTHTQKIIYQSVSFFLNFQCSLFWKLLHVNSRCVWKVGSCESGNPGVVATCWSHGRSGLRDELSFSFTSVGFVFVLVCFFLNAVQFRVKVCAFWDQKGSIWPYSKHAKLWVLKFGIFCW